MPLNRPTYDALVSNVETSISSRLTGGNRLIPNSVLYVLARVFAGILHMLYGSLDFLSNNLLEDRASGDWLKRLMYRRGLTKNAPSFAGGVVTLTGDEGTEIPKDFVIVRADGIEYRTTTSGTIPGGGSVNINVVCDTEDTVGNCLEGTEFSALESLAGLDDTVIAAEEIRGGGPEESDEAARQRLLAVIRTPGLGGSLSDYKAWALEIPGVFRVKPFGPEDYLGPGTVGVALAGPTEGEPEVTEEVREAVETNINTKKPITAVVTVASVTEVVIDYEIAITPYTQAVRDACEAELRRMFYEESEARMKIRASSVVSACKAVGADDAEVVTIYKDGVVQPGTSLQLINFEYPTLDEVTFTELDEDD